MNHPDNPPMANYPSPPPPGHNGFYTSNSGQPQDQRQPDPEGLQLAAQLSGSLAEPLMRQNEADAQMAGQIDPNQNHQYEGQQAPPYEGQQAAQFEAQQAQMVHDQLNHDQGPAYGTPTTPQGGDPMESKKRTKVSRACDECRRKKIRCDAFSEQTTCSNCKRVSARCQFSRVPQKRGPNKGYIKELSDRVNNLEARDRHAMGEVFTASLNSGASPRSYEEFPASGNPSNRKRNHSNISNDYGGSPYPAYRQPGLDWQGPNQQRSSSGYPRGPPVAGSIVDNNGYPAYPPDSMAPQPTWPNAPDGAAGPTGASAEASSQNGHSQADRHLDWSGVLDRYYEVLHPILPFLPSTPAKFLARISRPNCPANVEEALYEAMQSVNGCLLLEDGSPRMELGSRAMHDDAIKSPFDAAGSRTLATNLLYLQAMVFRIVEADNLGPNHTNQVTYWLSLAVGLAATTRLHVPFQDDSPAEFDPDSDEFLGRRVWWCLVILDRMHALSTSTPVMIPDTCVIPLGIDKLLLGEMSYQLARLSIVQGHAARLCLLPKDPNTAPVFREILNGEMERCRESIEITDYSQYPVLYLQILYLRLLIKRVDPTLEPIDLLLPANQIADILRNTHPITPFNHHYAAIAAFTFVELRDIQKIAPDHPEMQWLSEVNAGRNLKNEGNDWYSAMMALLSGESSSHLSMSRPGKDGSSTQGASLHHLADLATAEGGKTAVNQAASADEGGNKELKKEGGTKVSAEKIWEPVDLMRAGYLLVLGSHLIKP